MNIEITKPEVEALIQQRLQDGGVATPEEMIFEALRVFEIPRQPRGHASGERKFENLSDLLLNSPFAGAGLDLDRARDYPRSVEIR